MEEVGGIQGTRTPVKDVVINRLGTGKDFYGQSFWVCDPLQWLRRGAGSLRGESEK